MVKMIFISNPSGSSTRYCPSWRCRVSWRSLGDEFGVTSWEKHFQFSSGITFWTPEQFSLFFQVRGVRVKFFEEFVTLDVFFYPTQVIQAVRFSSPIDNWRSQITTIPKKGHQSQLPGLYSSYYFVIFRPKNHHPQSLRSKCPDSKDWYGRNGVEAAQSCGKVPWFGPSEKRDSFSTTPQWLKTQN